MQKNVVNFPVCFVCCFVFSLLRCVASLWMTDSLTNPQNMALLRSENTEPVSTVLYASGILALPSLLIPTTFSPLTSTPPSFPSTRSDSQDITSSRPENTEPVSTVLRLITFCWLHSNCSAYYIGVAYTKLFLLFSVRRSNLALNTATKSCGGSFGLVHSRFCYAAVNCVCNFTRAL